VPFGSDLISVFGSAFPRRSRRRRRWRRKRRKRRKRRRSEMVTIRLRVAIEEF